MRILHVFDHSLPLQSGYSVRSLGIIRAQHGFGWQTVLVTGPRHNEAAAPEEIVEGLRFHRTPRPARPMIREAAEMRALGRRLDAVIAATRPDIVHAHSPVLVGWPALRAARRAGLPFVYEVRALWEDAAVDLGRTRPNALRYRASRAFETHVLRRADAVVTLCDGLREEIAARRVPAGRIAIVGNAIDPDRFAWPAPKDPSRLGELGLAGRKVLGFVGSFYRYEGLDLLLTALARLRAAHPDLALLLAGGGPEEHRLRAQAEAAGLSDAVRFTGRLQQEHAARLYGLIDLLVLPRRRIRLTELVTPLKPLEGMAAGCLVLASDVGGHRELIDDDETGFLFPADDTDALGRRIAQILHNPLRHAEIRAAARAYVARERTWPVTARAYEAVYTRLFPNRPAHPRSRRTPRFIST